MRILFIAMYDPALEITGATYRGGHLVRYLAARHELHLLRMSGSGHAVSREIERSGEGRLPGVASITTVEFNRCGYFVHSPTFRRRALELTRSIRPDVIFADYGFACREGLTAARTVDVPFVYGPHNVEHHWYVHAGIRWDRRRLLLWPHIYRWERMACRAASLLVTISKRDSEYFCRWTEDSKIELVPQGYDASEIAPAVEKASDPPMVLFVGSMKDQENLAAAEVIVKHIAPRVLDQRPDVRFVCAGNGAPPWLQNGQVEFPGFVKDLSLLLAQGSIFINPILSSAGMSTKVIQALANNLPTIVTEQGLGAIDPTFETLAIERVECFADRILAFLDNPPKWSCEGRHAFEEQHDWSRSLARLDSKLRQLV